MSTLVTLPKNGGLSKRTRPFSGFPLLSDWFDDFSLSEFPSMFNSSFNTGMSLPKVNIKEETDAYIVEMAVPGLKKTDFHINLENNTLSISAEINESNENKNEGYTRREFGYSSFKRAFTLPETVEEGKIRANYSEGILHVHLPKKEEAKQKPPREIKIS
ncbi:Hsp20/alpha crystallin family protein [Snuella sedimenti]|uniref:Hsp20/alpha crystallin family protein n=1 Tax=Snuella sedimenti TaxID=2798802 RepID=A0A8J7IHJ9_9FLAO|nr:Hsp20/alpha crystallin family protein [Snuella sedimenti]MBJ6368523.1 Hsp20/alpha crystallin family protein [Snuella sedimenti]